MIEKLHLNEDIREEKERLTGKRLAITSGGKTLFEDIDKIVYIDDLYHDLLRRDFTINTLCMTKDGAIIDLLDGKKDLNERIIRVVGDANIKLSEDLLRIMRAIRFATTLNFNLDTSTRACILKYAPLLKKLSYERKKEELNKIFLSPNNQYGIKLMLELGLDQSLDIPNLKKVDVYDDISALWTILDVDDLYPFSHNEKKQMKLIREIAKHDPLESYSLYQNGLYLSILAGMLNHIDKTKITQQYESLPIKTSHDLAITSDKICDTLNKKPGPWLKLMLEDITKKIINGYIKNEQTAIIKYIMSI